MVELKDRTWRTTGGPCTLAPTAGDWRVVVENRGLMYAALGECGVPLALQDECVSDFGYRVMLRCARSFDPEKGKLSTLVYRAMGGAVAQWWAKQARRAAKGKFLSADLMHEHGWDPSVDDAGVRRFEAGQTVGMLLVRLGRLDDRKRLAVSLRYLEGKTLMAVGEAMGVGKERARQLVVAGLRAMRGMVA